VASVELNIKKRVLNGIDRMDLQRIMGLTRKDVEKYNMIEEGDRIAVGISGGKDSITLLYALNGLKKYYTKKFEIEAVTVDVGFGMDLSPIAELCRGLGVRYTVVHTNIKQIVFDAMGEENPCSLCAKMRKGALNDEIIKLGCNKVAYGHHKDDVVVTMLMSLMYEGRFSSFLPVTYLDGTGLSVIRPLMLVSESEIIGFCNKQNVPIVKNRCPVDKKTKREYVSELLKQLNRDSHGVRDRMFSAIDSQFYPEWYRENPLPDIKPLINNNPLPDMETTTE